MQQAAASPTIIVLDDDPMIGKIIGSATERPTSNYESIEALSGDLEALQPLVFFIDIHVGVQGNGLDMIPALRFRWPFVPILVITQDRCEDAVGHALAAGADDFIYKPLNPKEVVARLQARLGELANRQKREVISLADIKIDTSHRLLTNLQGDQRYLSPTEQALLLCLLDAQGTVVRREVIKRRCWGRIYVSDNALNRKLHEVRRALKDVSDAVTIKTIYATGFMLETTITPETQRKSA